MEQPDRLQPLASAIREFIRLESIGGFLLLAATITALIAANTLFAEAYAALLNTTVAVQVGALVITKPLLLWINDGLMAIFFFLIGLEVKREFVEGELSSARQVVLPGLGAFGGMIVPAAIYVALNWQDSVALDGWAIPVATDIAFALALLSVFGRRVPTALKVFLLTLAIFDDLAAIVIIAIFYSADLSLKALVVGAVALSAGIALNRLKVTLIAAYVFLGVVLWVAMLKSGVHATLAGVLIAFCVPLQGSNGRSPLRELEHDLHAPVTYAILPIFAFANAGLSLSGIGIGDLLHPVTLGVATGLFIGKPLGIVIFIGLGVLLRLVSLPKDVTWYQILGVAWACGIGFTMSLFIAGLAFQHGSGEYFAGDRLGILIGSMASALAAWLMLHWSLGPAQGQPDAGEISENAAEMH
ncbi:MAG: Na+/H+ antiporter NhaA [Gammaproteobacteria bacterium]|nr:Na+/H+ antiporter NhaA [Gammaproteobacteria bacterium]